MTVKFNVKLSSEDMYRFNMYHAYTSMQGILSLVMGIFVIVVIALSENLHDIRHALPYLLIALIFLLYVPLTLRIRSKRQIHMSDALKDVLHFEMREDGIAVTTDHETEEAVLPWDMIYKAVTTKHNLLIYSNRVNAYIIPKAQATEELPQIYAMLRQHCKDYRLHIKGDKLMIKETFSPEETFAFGEELGKNARPGQVYTLIGDLGVGKTVLTQGIAKGLGIDEAICSPTFTIVQEYHTGRMPFYHFDVYRIGCVEEMDEIGFDDYVYGEGLTMIEWANLIEEILPDHFWQIVIEKDLEKGFDYRMITVEEVGKA